MSFSEAIQFEQLYNSALKCAQGLMWKTAVCDFVTHLPFKITKLKTDIVTNHYKLSKYTYFKIYEPKERLIEATTFVDRVFQKAMCDCGLIDQITHGFIYDNGACLTDKGLHFTIHRVKGFLMDFYQKNKSNEGYAIHLDVRKFFPSTPHSVIKEIVRKEVDEYFYPYIADIIDSFRDVRSKEEIEQDEFGLRGIGLGSQISQLLQLLLLSSTDHFIKEKLHIKYYSRYMDDMILIHKDKNVLLNARDRIEKELKKLGLQLKPCGGCVKLSQGFKFLKIHYNLLDSGKIRMKIDNKNLQKERRRLKKMKKKYDSGKLSKNKLREHYICWRSSSNKTTNKGDYKLMDCYFLDLFKFWPLNKEKK